MQPNFGTTGGYKGTGDGRMGIKFNHLSRVIEGARPLGNMVTVTQEYKTNTKKRPGMGINTYGQTLDSYAEANDGTTFKVEIDDAANFQNIRIALLADIQESKKDAGAIKLGAHLHHDLSAVLPNFKINSGTIVVKELPQLTVGSGTASMLFIQSQPHATPLSVTLVDPGKSDATLQIAVVGRDATITLATTALGAIKSSVGDILTAAKAYEKDFEIFLLEGTDVTAVVAEAAKTPMSAPTTIYSDGVDYRVDYEESLIYALATGILISGRPYQIEYNIASHTVVKMDGGVQLIHSGSFEFKLANIADSSKPRQRLTIPYAKIQATGDIKWMSSEDFMKIEFSISPELVIGETSSFYLEALT